MLTAWLAPAGTVDGLLGPTAVFPRSSLRNLLSERRRRADGSVLSHPLDGPAEPFSTSTTKKTVRRREPQRSITRAARASTAAPRRPPSGRPPGRRPRAPGVCLPGVREDGRAP